MSELRPLASVLRPGVAAAPAAVRKTVTALFAEIVDAASPGCELDPEVRGRVLSRCLGDLRTVLERHGGSVETHAGDVLIAVFGIPVVHEDDALRALRAAVELRRSVLTVGDDLGRDDECRCRWGPPGPSRGACRRSAKLCM